MIIINRDACTKYVHGHVHLMASTICFFFKLYIIKNMQLIKFNYLRGCVTLLCLCYSGNGITSKRICYVD